jgi:hypothetical protein
MARAALSAVSLRLAGRGVPFGAIAPALSVNIRHSRLA